MAKDGRVMIDKFNGNDFGFWRLQIEDVLYQKKLHEPLTKIKPEDMKEDDWLLLDRQALGVVSHFIVPKLGPDMQISYASPKDVTGYNETKAIRGEKQLRMVSSRLRVSSRLGDEQQLRMSNILNLVGKKWHFLCLTHSVGEAFSGTV
ncbi:hypothetical protein LXL04_022972 [Taraxacum kok-saghyz]